jgi:hypothetical protein
MNPASMRPWHLRQDNSLSAILLPFRDPRHDAVHRHAQRFAEYSETEHMTAYVLRLSRPPNLPGAITAGGGTPAAAADRDHGA